MQTVKFFSIFISAFFLMLVSFQLPSSIQKKVDKEIKKAFSLDEFLLEEFEVSKDINASLKTKITKENFFKISVNKTVIGYAFVDKAPSKTDQFDYLVLFDKNLIIKKAKVLVYREDYGGEIGSKRWLKQFIGKTSNDNLQYEKDIIAISGATISANSMTIAVNNLLKTIAYLHNLKIL